MKFEYEPRDYLSPDQKKDMKHKSRPLLSNVGKDV